MTPEIARLPTHTQGLYRTTIVGPGRSLLDAFANVEQSPRVERVLRHAERDLVCARVTLAREEGHGYWELTRIRNDLHIILGNYSYHTHRIEPVPGDGLVQFNFKLSGDMTYAVDSAPLRFNRPSLHLWRQPRGVDMQEWTQPASHERIVTIVVRPELLASYFFEPHVEVPPRLQAFVSEPGDTVDFCELPLTAQMLDITSRLIDNPYTGSFYLLYKEALAFELLCVAVANFLSRSDPPAGECSDRKLRALNAARERLMEQFAPPPSLQQLARAAGLSVRGLTRGFKAVYGETVFDFSLRCRMQHALTLLRDRCWPVDRVSEAVGYSHSTSFATAFQRYFGRSPSTMRRSKGGVDSAARIKT